MRSTVVVALLFGLVAGGLEESRAENCALNKTGFGKTRQQLRNCQGTHCPGVKTPYDCGPLDVEISPSLVRAKVNEPVRLRIDSTQMCNGQSVKDFRGYIKWETGSTCELTDSYGAVDHTYATGGEYKVEIEMTCTCFDTKGQSTCTSRGSVPVTITP